MTCRCPRSRRSGRGSLGKSSEVEVKHGVEVEILGRLVLWCLLGFASEGLELLLGVGREGGGVGARVGDGLGDA